MHESGHDIGRVGRRDGSNQHPGSNSDPTKHIRKIMKDLAVLSEPSFFILKKSTRSRSKWSKDSRPKVLSLHGGPTGKVLRGQLLEIKPTDTHNTYMEAMSAKDN